jgi:carboxymethylenebutenolidase
MFHRPAFALFALLLVLRGSAVAAEISLVVPTAERPVSVRVFAASGEAPRPAVLILHGRQGIAPIAHCERLATALAAAGIDAWLFSYYSPEDDKIIGRLERGERVKFFNTRLRAWAKEISDMAGVAMAQKNNSGRVGLLGQSNGGILAVAAAANDPRIAALVVFYGGIPDPMHEEIARLPPLLALHGDADQVIPIGQGRALVDRATALGGQGELIVYPGAGHGFDFDSASRDGVDAISRAVEFLHRQLTAK